MQLYLPPSKHPSELYPKNVPIVIRPKYDLGGFAALIS